MPAFEPLKLIGKSLFMTRPELLDCVETREALDRRRALGYVDEVEGAARDQ